MKSAAFEAVTYYYKPVLNDFQMSVNQQTQV